MPGDASEVQPQENPNIEDLTRAAASAQARNVALTSLFVLACFYTLYLARDFVLPLVLALLLSFLFSPLVRALARARIPHSIGAAAVLLGVSVLIGAGAYELSGPVAAWVQRMPQIARKLETQVREFRKPVEQVKRATEQVSQLADVGGSSGTPKVQIAPPSATETVLNTDQCRLPHHPSLFPPRRRRPLPRQAG